MATVNTPRGLPVIARLSATAVLVMSTAVFVVLSNKKTASVWGVGGERADAIGEC